MPPEQANPTRAWIVLVTLVRYLLGLTILTYGISKLLNYQFQVSAWTYDQPLIRAPGSMLTWAFLGYQPWFQFLLGVFETVPGLLLLSRRTWRLGALLLLPVLLNVVLMNFAMELWLSTRIISSVLLFLNLFLMACDLPLYRSFFVAMLPAPAPFRSPRIRLAATIAAILLPVAAMSGFWVFGMLPIRFAVSDIADFVGVRQINGAGAWAVDRITIGSHELSGDAKRRFYFDIWMKCAYKSGLEETQGSFKASKISHSITLSGLSLAGDSSPITASYSLEGKALKIRGQRSGQPIEIDLHRLNWGPMLPLGP